MGPHVLVDAEPGHAGQPVRVVDQRLTIGDDGAHHRMPADQEIAGGRGDSLVGLHPAHRRPPGPFGQHRPRPDLL